jgi:hypothetical protein
MAGVFIRSTFSIRCIVALTAATFALPLPARCAGCSGVSQDPTHCSAPSESESASNAQSCCARHAAPRTIAATSDNCDRIQSQSCGCNVRPVDRTIVAGEQQTTLPQLLAVLPAGDDVLSASTQFQIQAAPAFASLPPPVPHRILHCSWII